jgi:hypothetical protein
MNGLVDISTFHIANHCRKRWKKRWLDFTPKGEVRRRDIEDFIIEPMKIIKEYPARDTIRVTDGRYEFVVNLQRQVIITLNVHKKLTTKEVYLKKKERR